MLLQDASDSQEAVDVLRVVGQAELELLERLFLLVVVIECRCQIEMAF